MPNTSIRAAAEGLPKFTRRGAIGLIAAIVTPTVALTSEVPSMREEAPAPSLTPEEQLAAATAAMESAMIAIHGEGVRILRNGNHIISFLEPEKPRIVEWQGDGEYEVELTKKLQPIFRIGRFPAFDDYNDGRCYRLEPRDAKHLGIRYLHEAELQRVIIRKIR